LYGKAKHLVTCCLFHLERKNWKFDIASKAKFRWYIELKTDYDETQRYVQRTKVKAQRSLLTCKEGKAHCILKLAGMSAFLWKKDRVGHVIQAWWRMRSTSVHVGCPGMKEARGPLLKLIEQAQPGIGLLPQDKESSSE